MEVLGDKLADQGNLISLINHYLHFSPVSANREEKPHQKVSQVCDTGTGALSLKLGNSEPT